MTAASDPMYMRLYSEYSRAIRAYERAVQDRRRVRDRLEVRQLPVIRAMQALPRRPVGAPVDWKPSSGAASNSARAQGPSGATTGPSPGARKVYLGPILGWARIQPTEPAATPDAVAAFANHDFDQLYDNISLALYWNRKMEYLRAKQAFFDYVRRKNPDAARDRVASRVRFAAHQMSLGDDVAAEDSLAAARRDFETMAQNAWRIYDSSPRPKSFEVKLLLLETVADGQFLIVESSLFKTMKAEVQRLVSAGEVSIGRS